MVYVSLQIFMFAVYKYLLADVIIILKDLCSAMYSGICIGANGGALMRLTGVRRDELLGVA